MSRRADSGEPGGASKRSGTISWLLRIGGTLGIFAIIARQVDVAKVGALLGATPIWFWPPAVLLGAAQITLVAVRWQRIAVTLGTRLGGQVATRAVFVSVAINQCLPSFVGGDAYRVLAARQRGMGLESAVHSVVIDRICALVSLVLIVLASAPLLYQRVPPGPVQYGFAAVLAAGVALLILVVGGASVLQPFRGVALVGRIADLLDQARRVLVLDAGSPTLMAIAIVSHLIGSLALWVGAAALGAKLGALDSMLIVPWVTLTLSIPLSVAGWGLREGAMVGALSLWGIGMETAVALSILMGLVGVINGIFGMVWWVASGENPLEVLRGAARQLRERSGQ